MNSFHCSLSAMGIPSGKSRRRMFIPPPRLEMPQRWASAAQMIAEIGYYPGEWKLSRLYVGHLEGLQIVGTLLATDQTRALFQGNDGKVRIIHKYNFVHHFEVPEKPEELS